jgi:hypothetical protein
MAPATIIPGPVPLDLVVPVGDPVGARLLKLMAGLYKFNAIEPDLLQSAWFQPLNL